MKNQFVKTIDSLLKKDKRLVLLLGDIGVYAFKDAFKKFPDRVYNIGILEQSMVGLASGLAINGFIPVLHSIAPFLIERALEQIKIDFGYQNLSGKFVSVGASYDYSTLGSTHHCPGDIGILSNIPNMEIVLPGNPLEFDSLFRKSFDNNKSTYYRLSERSNKTNIKVKFGTANIIKKGKKATIIVVGPMLDLALESCEKEDVTIIYYTTIEPFDYKILQTNKLSKNILVLEPYYSGAIARKIHMGFPRQKINLEFIGIPHKFLTYYGTQDKFNQILGFTIKNVRNKLKNLYE